MISHLSASASTRSSVLNLAGKMLLHFLLPLFIALTATTYARADDYAQLDKDARAALNTLYGDIAAAKVLGEKSRAILVFPSITKAGLVIGGQYGKGVLMENGKTVGYYSSTAGSIGLQAGAQTYGYVMFFMTDKAVKDFKSVDGFEVGVGPTIVVVDAGMAKNLTTATAKDDIYAFIFGQKGLMAGIGLQGSKISKLDKK